MDYEAVKVCTQLSEQEKIAFPEVIKLLNEAGVGLYYADLLVPSKTFYSHDEAYVAPCSMSSKKELGSVFNAENVEKSIRLAQSGQIKYQEFLRLIMSAGVIAYYVFIKGRKAVYFGQLGEQHVEPFP